MREEKKMWKSLDEKYQTPEFLAQAEKEFQSSPLKEEDDSSGLARRQFMKLMGASIALSSAACVRRPVQKIIPYNKRPSEVIIGLPNYYASSIFDGREGFSITVKTREGRPLHLEGNRDYPGHGPGLSARGSAQILNLYDPDRVRTPTVNSQDPNKRGNKLSIPRDWSSLDEKAVEAFKEGGVHILTADSPSPSFKSLLHRFADNHNAKIHYWSPVNHWEIVKASRQCYGQDLVPRYRYDKAKYILSIDGDFLGTHLNPTESSRLFAQGRKPEGNMSKLVSFQSVTSLTSLNADDNFPIKPSQQLPLVLSILHELAIVKKRVSVPGSFQTTLKKYGDAYKKMGLEASEFTEIVDQLWESRGQSVVVTGGPVAKTKDAFALQIATNYLNHLLDNDGQTVHWSGGLRGLGNWDGDVIKLIEQMKKGEVKTLVINELDPLFALPESIGFKDLLSKVETVIVTNNWMDETARFADLVAPAGHPMENWGDNEFTPGLVTVQQPTIRPLHDTRSFADSLLTWSKMMDKPLSDEDNYADHLKKAWVKRLGSEEAWYDFLQKGFQGELHSGIERVMGFNTQSLDNVKVNQEESSLELSLYVKSAIHDGTMSNLSWLQELPDPVSKIVWDNYLMISPQLADTHKLRDGAMVQLTVGGQKIELPVYISPGQHPESIAVALGYGYREGGELQKGVGFNVQSLIEAQGARFIFAGRSAEIKPLNKTYDLAQTQGHHSMEGHDIAIETTHSKYKKTSDIGLHRHEIFSLWGGHKYEGHKWAMGVDLNSCTGCSACMVACQSENNIPAVGKKYVLSGREMHWIRIDRYFSGDESKSVDAIFQPVMCQHCENAPCETVCPVLATVHSDEGLNDMVYNRCVGTRYCSNNCPYKVRRFNWFYYDGHHRREPLHMALNPDVTVRTRGVMEKCTFCVQRIKEAKNIAKDEKRDLKDGDVRTACQSVCPTDAIVFGDLNDENSRVKKWFDSQRQYTLLEEWHAAPRVRYLAKIRNTDRDLGGDHHHDDHHAEAKPQSAPQQGGQA